MAAVHLADAVGGSMFLGTRCTTLNKMCGSGMEATILAHDRLLARLRHVLAAMDAAVAPVKVDEVAFSAGFNSISAFYTCFRQHTGQSPKAYAKQISLRARTQDAG